MGKKDRKRRGRSHEKRVADVNRIYERYARTGLSNREIWRRYIYPVWGICERQFYNLLKDERAAEPVRELAEEGFLFPDLFNDHDEQRHSSYYRKST